MAKSKPKKKVAILGYTPSRSKAPFDDPSFEIWGLNDLYKQDDITRWDRWFQIHTPEDVNENKNRVQWHKLLVDYAQWDCPVYFQEAIPGLKNSVKYPLDEIVAHFGRYFTNSISYMIALAIYEGFEEIHVYGVDMSTATEYAHQRPSCEYFLGWAKGAGIKIHIPLESDLLKARWLYGYEYEKQNAWDAKLRETIRAMKDRQAAAQEELRRVERVEAQYDGAISACEDIKKWTI